MGAIVKLLLGGSPCTNWSIAQSKARETKPEGIGWELFKNYLIAKEKFQPDFFLYENNKSAAKAIKDQISEELGQPLQYINSALVSAQNRQRFYVHNIPNVPQPEDRGILLRDIIESGEPWLDKSYAFTTRCSGAIPSDTLKRHRHTMIAERLGSLPTESGKVKNGQAQRIYGIDGKSVALKATDGGGGAATGLYAQPLGAYAGRVVGRRINEEGHRDDYNTDIGRVQRFEVNDNPQKTNTISTVAKDNMIAEPINYEPNRNSDIVVTENSMRMQRRDQKHSSIQGSHVTLPTGKTQTVSTSHIPMVFQEADGKQKPIYEVRNGLITIKGLTYAIKLPDGYYIIRKLTVTECCRLQTMPDDYCHAVSNTQAYKGLGNGWTAEVIMHILRHANVPLDEEIVVLSMYDGIGTGRYCFDKLGYKNVTYYAYEIDKYPIQIAMSNYPDIIQCGDAFQVRESGWRIA